MFSIYIRSCKKLFKTNLHQNTWVLKTSKMVHANLLDFDECQHVSDIWSTTIHLYTVFLWPVYTVKSDLGGHTFHSFYTAHSIWNGYECFLFQDHANMYLKSSLAGNSSLHQKELTYFSHFPYHLLYFTRLYVYYTKLVKVYTKTNSLGEKYIL